MFTKLLSRVMRFLIFSNTHRFQAWLLKIGKNHSGCNLRYEACGILLRSAFAGFHYRGSILSIGLLFVLCSNVYSLLNYLIVSLYLSLKSGA